MTEQSISGTSHAGRCLCGAVSYTIDGLLRDVVICHCGQCRRFHGHVAAYTAAPRSQVTIDDLHKQLKWYASSDKARRGFCSRCGSSLFWDEYGTDLLRIAAGALDQPTGLQTTTHIYIDDRGDYYVLADDLEKRPHGLRD
ncbi:MAG: GFA family protein [Gammaproteobacteria bacterium]